VSQIDSWLGIGGQRGRSFVIGQSAWWHWRRMRLWFSPSYWRMRSRFKNGIILVTLPMKNVVRLPTKNAPEGDPEALDGHKGQD
jgi:hypothetical protein